MLPSRKSYSLNSDNAEDVVEQQDSQDSPKY